MDLVKIQTYISLIGDEVALLDLTLLPHAPVTLEVGQSLPNTSGIYFVTDESMSRLFYVGRAVNLRGRWKVDRNIFNDVMPVSWNNTIVRATELGGCHVRWFPCPKELLTVLEMAAIQRFKPEWNQVRC